ncbi:hypothetical protein SLEP1_g15854 [Rubroshorea leprosula]|uniref:Transmembrane protein n=1 Tax=Rubroshorea leprosula TaxID=152421 RepID=A0AAV5ISZ5_9ROSI|nr:hypothetical protein SLEP1_g15854 [Rubroshorea leprosula]
MMNPLEALTTHLREDAKNGSRSAILFAQIALFTATIFFCKTTLYAEHDRTGFKTALAYPIIAILVSNSSRLNGLGFIRRTCGYKVNSIVTLIWFILSIVLEKFYEKSLCSLGFTLSITVLFLILLVIIRPSTDLGLFGFLIGVIGSVALDLFGLKFQIWIVVAICFLLLVFRFWLDSLPLDRSTGGTNQISKSQIIEELMVANFHLFWVYHLFRTNCRSKKEPPKYISCNPSSVMKMLACVLIFNLWFGYALIPRVCYLFRRNPESAPRASAESGASWVFYQVEAVNSYAPFHNMNMDGGGWKEMLACVLCSLFRRNPESAARSYDLQVLNGYAPYDFQVVNSYALYDFEVVNSYAPFHNMNMDGGWKEMLACVLIFNLWFGPALIPRVCSLFRRKPESAAQS